MRFALQPSKSGVSHLNNWLYRIARRAVSNWTFVIRRSSTNRQTYTNHCKTGEFMTASSLKKFLALYLVPVHVLASWAKTADNVRDFSTQHIV
jgi:hypothetical protein